MFDQLKELIRPLWWYGSRRALCLFTVLAVLFLAALVVPFLKGTGCILLVFSDASGRNWTIQWDPEGAADRGSLLVHISQGPPRPRFTGPIPTICGIEFDHITHAGKNEWHFGCSQWLAVILLGTGAYFAWRRFAWRRFLGDGYCRKCGYDLRRHHPGDKCPECGVVIPERACPHRKVRTSIKAFAKPPYTPFS